MIRILHTSDWHLGVSLEQAPRHDEHRRFLVWLRERAIERRIDALVVCGDLFHYMQPSAAAQRDLYDFVASLSDTGVSVVILTAGNHDSASRLEAPREVLAALDVRVVGALTTQVDDCLVPIANAAGEVEAVVAAVPYLSESRLGIATTRDSHEVVSERYRAAFAEVYAATLDAAQSRYPHAAKIATGHLTCTAEESVSRASDFRTPIHQFSGGTRGLPPSIFAGWDYAALGHVHRHHRVGDSNAWYPGTPIPTNVMESRSPRFVIEVEVEAGDVSRVTPLRVPRWRDVFELVGDEDELLDLLKGLQWDSELAPYLYIERLVWTPTRAGVDRFVQFVADQFAEPRPRIVGFKKRLMAAGESLAEPEQKMIFGPSSLRDVTPEEVFVQMYELKHGVSPPDHVVSAFRTLLVSDEQSASLDDLPLFERAKSGSLASKGG